MTIYTDEFSSIANYYSRSIDKEIKFVAFRKRGSSHITFRHRNTLRRLTEAFARSRLSDEICEEDLLSAVRTFENCIASLGISDLDLLTGINDDDRKAYRQILPLLPCSLNEILAMGIPEINVERLIGNGHLIRGKNGFILPIGGEP